MAHLSPLRYPGGKARLADFLTDAIDLNDLRDCAFYEAYAGGAGAAVTLLESKVVSRIHLNDADRRIFCFWKSVLDETDEFAETILSTPVTIAEWHRQHSICSKPYGHSRIEIGFAAFFMNRCNRSGVLSGAGPIGGYEQTGKWRLNVRFNPTGLAERILQLGRLRDRIDVSCQDAIKFLKSKLPKGGKRKGVFVYLDPPYVAKGQRLYLNAYDARDHAELSRYLLNQKLLPWIMSYDDSTLVRSLYKSCSVSMLPIQYSLQVKRSAQELVIAPGHVVVPAAVRMGNSETLLKKAV